MATDLDDKILQQYREAKGENRFNGLKDFGIFLIENKVLSFIIAFAIANAANQLIHSFTKYILVKFRIKVITRDYLGELVTSVVSFMLTIVVTFFLFYYVFSKIFLTEEVVQEAEVKEVLSKAREKEIEEKATQLKK